MASQIDRAAERALSSVPEKVDEVGTQVSLAIHNAVLDAGEPVRGAVDVLHGTWLGHPLHPVLTDVVIGSWVVGSVYDAVGQLRGSRRARRIGDRLAAIGTVAALPTAISGLADFSTFPEPAARPATLHAALNTVCVGMYAESLRLRRRGRRHRRRALTMSWLAQGVMVMSAWLGGALVYKHKVGVDHSEQFEGPQDWTPVLDDAELADGEPRRVDVEGKGVLLYRESGRVYAIGSVCSHAGGPLEEGRVEAACVTCPWHDSVFDLRDGRIVHGPATQPQPVLEARVRGGKIEVRLATG